MCGVTEFGGRTINRI